ncbi:MAG: hypothetical protein ABIA74_04585 [bacterium]
MKFKNLTKFFILFLMLSQNISAQPPPPPPPAPPAPPAPPPPGAPAAPGMPSIKPTIKKDVWNEKLKKRYKNIFQALSKNIIIQALGNIKETLTKLNSGEITIPELDKLGEGEGKVQTRQEIQIVYNALKNKFDEIISDLDKVKIEIDEENDTAYIKPYSFDVDEIDRKMATCWYQLESKLEEKITNKTQRNLYVEKITTFIDENFNIPISKLTVNIKTTEKEASAAATIQRVARGYLGREETKKRKEEKEQEELQKEQKQRQEFVRTGLEKAKLSKALKRRPPTKKRKNNDD